MRRRLRDLPDLKATYATPYDHTRWEDHKARVSWTIRWAVLDIIGNCSGASIIDLSCGDGAIALGVAEQLGTPRDLVTLGDYVRRDDGLLDLVGPIEDTIVDMQMPHNFRWDVMICSETLEHLNDPELVLNHARNVARHLIITTPNTERGHQNPEHVWEWDTDGVREMLEAWNWKVTQPRLLDTFWYEYQYWWCSQ